MHRFNQRQGFLVSAVIHLTLLLMLIFHPPAPRRIETIDPTQLERKDRVFLPPNSVLKQIIPLAPRPDVPKPQPSAVPERRPVPAPTPEATALPPEKKDRISVGPPNDRRSEGPMELQRDQDLTKAAKGTVPIPIAPTPPPPPRPAPEVTGKPGPAVAERVDELKSVPGRSGLRLPPGLSSAAVLSGQEGQRGREGREATRQAPGNQGPQPDGTSLDRSLRAAVDDAARRLQADSRLGIPTGTGRDLGGLYFDPQGADFTLWVQRFQDEVYRNWIVPQSALLGVVRGHVDFEFVVERSGAVATIRLLKSTGTPALDRAAQNALSSGRYLPLPDDYRPQRLTIQVTFNYGEPRTS